VDSSRTVIAASSTPSASASQVRASARGRPDGGISRCTGVSVSRYSTITRESNTAPPSSMISTGTLASGLSCAMRLSGDQTSSSSYW
jgi:hypothetical protein